MDGLLKFLFLIILLWYSILDNNLSLEDFELCLNIHKFLYSTEAWIISFILSEVNFSYSDSSVIEFKFELVLSNSGWMLNINENIEKNINIGKL